MGAVIERLREAAYVLLDGDAGDYDPLMRHVGDARLVLLGVASYGSHELFHAQAHITRRLISEMGFAAVALGADTASTARINSYVRDASDDATANEALRDFKGYPNWPWRSAEIVDFVGWLRAYNDHFSRYTSKVGVYGLDVYNVYGSPEGSPESLLAAQRLNMSDARRRNSVVEDDPFLAGQQARLSSSGFDFYRVYSDEHSAWRNLHSMQMADIVDALLLHLESHDRAARIVVWEHLRSVADARAIERIGRDERSLGQLARQRHARSAHLIALTAFSGTILAAEEWGLPPKRRRLCPAVDGSFEALLHAVELPRFGLALNGLDALAEWRPERFIDFIYDPETEEIDNYLRARPAALVDQVVFFDEARSLEPLDPKGGRAHTALDRPRS
jgi:erythromycin esterase-like protein